MCTTVCLYVCLCITYVLCIWTPEESIGSPGPGVIGSFELSYGCWELNLGPLCS